LRVKVAQLRYHATQLRNYPKNSRRFNSKYRHLTS
jgi:hypothetical protein